MYLHIVKIQISGTKKYNKKAFANMSVYVYVRCLFWHATTTRYLLADESYNLIKTALRFLHIIIRQQIYVSSVLL